MLHSALPAIIPASVSFGERRLGQSTLSKPLSLGIGLMSGQQQQGLQRSPYPSPPMTGSSPSDNFLSQQNKPEHSPRHERLHDRPEITRHPYPENHLEPVPSFAVDESRRSHAVPMAVSSTIGRSPFMAQPPAPHQPQRKTKSHVASACVNCKKAHLACDVRRPCPRCVGLNKQDTCKDVQHKKRGRPRLRDERSHSFEVNQMTGVSSQREPTSPLLSPTTVAFSSYRGNTHRVIKSQTGDSHSRSGRSLNNYALRSPQSSQMTTYFDDRPMQGSYTVPQSNLKTLLTDNLVIAWATEQLREFLGLQADDVRKCAKSLFDLVSPDDRERLYRLISQIQAEIQMRDPTYIAPPSANVYAAIQSTSMNEIAHYCSQSGHLQETLNLRLPCGKTYRTVLRMQVVRTSVFFVVAELISVTEVLDLPQLKAPSPPQYFGSPAFGTVPVSMPIQPMSSPLQQNHPPDSLPYSVHRPRSVHSDSTYPSLAQYANAGSNYRNSLPHDVLNQSSNFRRHSDQPLAPNSVTLPPLRSFDRPNSSEEHIKTEPSANESIPMPKRIAVQDVLQ